jgi:hypothetical protein
MSSIDGRISMIAGVTSAAIGRGIEPISKMHPSAMHPRMDWDHRIMQSSVASFFTAQGIAI